MEGITISTVPTADEFFGSKHARGRKHPKNWRKKRRRRNKRAKHARRIHRRSR